MLKTSCPECGQAIPVAAPSGFCPACLLSLGLGPGVVRGPEPAPPSPLSAAPAARTGDADLEHPGLEVGRYTLRSVLGEGGFGTVWLAEQREPVRREVALKIIKRGMDTRRVVARFEAERQALALMDHPNIARVLDGGATDGGRPYFVLELVRGLPITEYCDARQLSTTDRIALFIPVCLAVQHAHQKSIIHRDLKPANILIAEEDADVRENLRQIFEQDGYTVIEADNGQAALHRYRTQAPDAIVLDLMLPDMDGVQFVEALRATSAGETLPVVVVTTKELASNDRERLNRSMNQALHKETFRGEDLLQTVRTALVAFTPLDIDSKE